MNESVGPCIWLIGGTSESAALARSLSGRKVPYVVTVTTKAAVAMYPPTAQTWVGRLTSTNVGQFVQRWQVRGILDASHPFAVEVSQLAIATSQTEAIAYLRYERTDIFSDISTDSPSGDAVSDDAVSEILLLESIEDVLERNILRKSASDASSTQRILFTIGYRALSKVSALRQSAQLFARVMPSQAAISGAIAAGFSSAEIMAIRPPVSAGLEAALWRQWEITHVVAKASGKAGGEAVKRAIAAELGVVLILIQRPQLIYPNQTNSISAATDFCVKTLGVY